MGHSTDRLSVAYWITDPAPLAGAGRRQETPAGIGLDG